MNTYNINDKEFINSNLYKSFMNENTSLGYLEIRASSFKDAMPIKNLEVEVSTEYKENIIIFFKGNTDLSGMIKKLALPTPKITASNLETPEKRIYKITINDNNKNYLVNIYENICVLQNILIEPSVNIERMIKWL